MKESKKDVVWMVGAVVASAVMFMADSTGHLDKIPDPFLALQPAPQVTWTSPSTRMVSDPMPSRVHFSLPTTSTMETR